MKVAMVTTHPIQYQVPWLKLLSATPGIDLTVFFAMIPDAVEQGREFGVAFEWDVPLLEGYRYKLLDNVAKSPSLTSFSGCNTPGIGDELRRGGFDAVIVNGWGSRTALQALVACRRAGIPCIVRGEANGLRPRSAVKRLAHRALLAQYAGYLTIGSNNRDYYRSLGVPSDRMFSTPYCVDNAGFHAGATRWRQSHSRAGLLERFGLRPDLPTLLYSGKFVPKKRPGDIVEALRLLRRQGGPEVQVLMVGNGPLGDELRASAQGLPIHFGGFLNQSEISAAYAACDCLVLPSDSGETWGLVVNEAMACGLPALVSDKVGCAVDLVAPGVTGERFPCGDVEEMAGALRTLVESGNLAGMGAAARELVDRNFSFERVVEGVLECLRSPAVSGTRGVAA